MPVSSDPTGCGQAGVLDASPETFTLSVFHMRTCTTAVMTSQGTHAKLIKLCYFNMYSILYIKFTSVELFLIKRKKKKRTLLSSYPQPAPLPLAGVFKMDFRSTKIHFHDKLPESRDMTPVQTPSILMQRVCFWLEVPCRNKDTDGLAGHRALQRIRNLSAGKEIDSRM